MNFAFATQMIEEGPPTCVHEKANVDSGSA